MRILAVDDVDDNLITLSALLRSGLPDWDMATAHSGAEAIEKARELQPDAIVLDVQMPGMDGFEACRLLKADPVTRRIPVIFLTARSLDPASRIRALEVGGDAFLTKPVDPGELIAQVSAMGRIKTAEDRLRSETRSRELLDEAGDAIFVADPDCLVREANARACEMFDYSRDEFVGLPVMAVVAEGEAARQAEAFSRVRRGDRVVEEQLFRRKDGTLFPGELVASQTESGDVLGIVRDITERKTREREIERLTRLYATLSHINQCIVRVKSREDLFQQVCEATAAHGGFKLAWIGWRDPTTQRVVPVARAGEDDGYLESGDAYADERPQGGGPVGTCIRDGRPAVFNDFLGAPEAAPWHDAALAHGLRAAAAFPIRFHGEVCGALTVYDSEEGSFQDKEVALLQEAAIDIEFALDHLAQEEQRQLAEEAAREEQELTRTVILSIPGTFYMIGADGRYVGWNAYQRDEIVGGPEDQMSETYAADTIHPDDRALVTQKIASVLTTGRDEAVEARVLLRGGPDYRWLLMTGRRMSIQGNSVLIGIGIDITERKSAEQEIRRLNESLERRVLERTAQFEAANQELEAFAYSVSHDLRAPLRAIDGFSAAVVEDAGDKLSADDREHLARVRAGAKRMGALIDALLGLSRASRQEIVIEAVDLSAVAEGVLAELREAEPERRVEAVVTPGITLETDAALLRVILANLLGNAWKFTSAHEAARIEVGVSASGDKRVYFVRDDGAGFDMRSAGRLFGAFQRMHRADEFEGDGIGLATVQRLVGRLGGRVWAEAEVEKGAAFFFTLSSQPPAG